MKSVGKRGFSLIEVMVAMFILIVIIASVMMLLSSSYTSLKESEAKNIAKNIATYTLEYIRSRTVTADNPLSNNSLDPDNELPGLIDLWGYPLKAVRTNVDTINIHPAIPSVTSYNTTSFYSSIQGYVSLTDSPTDSEPSSEDENAKVVDSKYYDRITDAPYVVRFPLDSSNLEKIDNFEALPGYNSKITSFPDDPHYVTDESEKAGATAYRGFRVLTQIVSRNKEVDAEHVQYYDVKITVFWITSGKEHEYSLASQIVVY